MMINKEGDTLFKRGYEKLKIYGLRIVKGFAWLNRFIKTNLLPHRLATLLILSLILAFSYVYGLHHKQKEEYKKAMTVSDTKQSLEFSKTGASFRLYPQKRYNDMTIVPFRMEDVDKQSTDAADYKVALMPVMRERLPSNLKTSIVFFGSSGEGAIAIKGDLKKEPLAVVVTNKSNFTTSNEGSGKLVIEGQKKEVDYNGVGFTINPKANNVKVDKTINTDMSMSDLYYTTFAKRQLADISNSFKKSKKDEKVLKNKETAKIKEIKKFNKALDKDENDMSYDNSEDTDSSSESVSSSSIDDMSDTDIKNKRNESIDELEGIRDDLKTEKDTQEGLQIQAEQLKDYTKNKIFDLLSINSKTEIRTNDSPQN